MRKIKQLMVLLASILSINTSLAQSVTIGPTSGTSGYFSGPICRFSTLQSSNYSKFAYLYTKEELGIPSGSTITKIEWLKANNGSSTGNNSFSISMGNSSLTSFASSVLMKDLNNTTQNVYSTTKLEYPSTLNYWLPFPVNFNYDGSSLLICADFIKTTGTVTGPLNFYNKAATGKVVQVLSPAVLTDLTTLVPSSGGVRPTIRITYTTPIMCSGAPNPGEIIVKSKSVCAGDQVTLSLSNKLTEGGITYDWQVSTNNSTFTSIGNSSSIITSQQVNSYYRCKVSCGSNSTFTNTIQISISDFYNCYCKSSAQSPTDEEITHFKLGNLDKISSVGIPVIFGVRPGDCGELAPGEGSVKSLYSNYRNETPTNIQIGSSVPFIVEVSLCGTNGAYNRAAIFIDLNRNGIFEDNEQVYLSPVVYGANANIRKGFIKIPETSQPGLTGVRVIVSETQGTINPCGLYAFGETEDYTINLVDNIDYDNTISKVVGLNKVCKGSSVLLYPSLTADSYQWIKGNGEIIDGATSFFYEPIISEPISFICQSKFNDNLKETEPFTIELNNFTDCYCDSRATGQADEDIVKFSLNGYSFSLSCTQQAPGKNSYLNEYSNYKSMGSLTTLQKGKSYSFTIVNDDCDIPASPYYNASVAGWIDFNQNGVFDTNEKVLQIDNCQGPITMNGTITIPISCQSGVTCLRLVLGGGLYGDYLTPCSKFQSGETEDYLITITN